MVILVLGLMLAGAGAGAGAAVARPSGSFDGASLRVDYAGVDTHSILALSLSLQGGSLRGDAPAVAARVDVAVPAGYTIDLSRAPGTTIGQLTAGIASAADESGFTFVDGAIVVDDPAVYAADAVAQACAPGAHTALWRASLSVVGQQIPLSIVVDAASGADAATHAYTIRFCPLRAPSAGLPVGVTFLLTSAYFEDLVSGPAAPGDYTWSALVTPATQFAPDPSRAFELRADIPVPQTFTMAARYDAKTKSAVLTGQLTAVGKPRAGVAISLAASSGTDSFETLGTVRTDASGGFRLRRAVGRTTRFGAQVSTDPESCAAPSTAPGGCLSETFAAPQDASATVIVPRKTDPRVTLRPRDQALALRSVVASSDFPGTWRSDGDVSGPCESFAPDLRNLTVTGQSFAPFFYAPDGTAAADSTASVFATPKDAATAFAGEAKTGAARCLAAESASGNKGSVARVAPLPLPRIGDATRAFRASVTSEYGQINIDVVFVRVGRVVLEIDVFALGAVETGLDLDLARKVVARARQP